MQRLELEVIPWDDREFVRTTVDCWRQLCEERPDVLPIVAARLVEQALRRTGYPAATVTCARTVDDVLRRRATWVVHRDGEASGAAIPAAIGLAAPAQRPIG